LPHSELLLQQRLLCLLLPGRLLQNGQRVKAALGDSARLYRRCGLL